MALGKLMKKIISDLINKKNKSKIVSLTAYSKNIASILDNFCDLILVGDSLGSVLYTDYILYFQLAGIILLLSMIGAILLTFRQRKGVKKQSYFNQISREPSSSIELKDVEFNKGVKVDD